MEQISFDTARQTLRMFAATASREDMAALMDVVRQLRQITIVTARDAFRVGQKATFVDKYGTEHLITITKICMKNIKGREDRTSSSLPMNWTVTATLLTHA